MADPNILLPPGAGQPLVGADGQPLSSQPLSSQQQERKPKLPESPEERQQMHDVLLIDVGRSVKTLATVAAQGVPRLDETLIHIANSLGIIAMAMQEMGLVDIEALQKAAAEQDAETQQEAPDAAE